MKKRIGAMFLALLFSLTAIPVFATSLDGARHGGDTIFASVAIVEEIKANLDEQQVKSFFDEKEVVLDFEHVIPVYMPLNLESSSTLSEALQFTNEYKLPVTDVNGNVMGMATLQQYKSKWVVGIFIANYDMKAILDHKSIEDDGSSYFVELNSISEIGLLHVSKGGETYTKLQDKEQFNTNAVQSGADILQQLKKDSATNSENSEGSGSAYIANTYTYPYIAIGIAIILVAIVFTVYILNRRNHSGA